MVGIPSPSVDWYLRTVPRRNYHSFTCSELLIIVIITKRIDVDECNESVIFGMWMCKHLGVWWIHIVLFLAISVLWGYWAIVSTCTVYKTSLLVMIYCQSNGLFLVVYFQNNFKPSSRHFILLRLIMLAFLYLNTLLKFE